MRLFAVVLVAGATVFATKRRIEAALSEDRHNGRQVKITYNDGDDILHVEFSKDPVVRDVSYGWNVNIAYGASGIAAITILDAKANGYWPLENAAELLRSAA